MLAEGPRNSGRRAGWPRQGDRQPGLDGGRRADRGAPSPSRNSKADKFIVMGTRRGVIKKTGSARSAIRAPAASSRWASKKAIPSLPCRSRMASSEIFIGTRSGMSIRFPEDDVRSMGRTAYGVRGVSLRDDDEVVGMDVLAPGERFSRLPSRATGSGPSSTSIVFSRGAASGSSTSRPAIGTAK